MLNDNDALNLKEFVVKTFDQNDISTYGMTFGISYHETEKTYFTTVTIEKNKTPDIVKNFQVRPTFNVLYSKNFDPNTQEYIAYAQDVDKIELPGLLMELSRMYFEQLGAITPSSSTKSDANDAPELSEVYQCQNCMTLYDSTYGDEQSGILPNTPFEKLPDDYCCGVCEGEKKYFKKILM